MARPAIRDARGFSLIELVLVMVMIGIMAAALTPVAFSSLTAYDKTLGDVEVLDKVRYATERLAREIREVNYSTSSGFAFTSMGANSMSFTRQFSYYDTSGNLTSTSDTLVTIGNTGSAVTLAYSSVSGVTPTLTDELDSTSGLAFSYFDANGDVTASVTNVRRVQITLQLRHNGNPYTQRTNVELKNIIGS